MIQADPLFGLASATRLMVRFYVLESRLQLAVTVDLKVEGTGPVADGKMFAIPAFAMGCSFLP